MKEVKSAVSEEEQEKTPTKRKSAATAHNPAWIFEKGMKAGRDFTVCGQAWMVFVP